MAKLIGLTGGIGSGKTTIANLLRTHGYQVYDTDSAAKRIVLTPLVRSQIEKLLGKDVYEADQYCTQKVAERVFTNPDLLKQLNAIVHPAVQNDLLLYSADENNGWIFVESAILYESGLNELCHYIVAVIAPKKLRIERTMTRDGKTREQVMARINTQMSNCSLRKKANYIVENNEKQSLTQLTDKLIKHLHKAIGSL
ncbi:MAG: dephospho-CoA kinase [Paludibacteraceae bacterium]|nr:dephospho-CoA kinase [Paludibacteraceae bacterium]